MIIIYKEGQSDFHLWENGVVDFPLFCTLNITKHTLYIYKPNNQRITLKVGEKQENWLRYQNTKDRWVSALGLFFGPYITRALRSYDRRYDLT